MSSLIDDSDSDMAPPPPRSKKSETKPVVSAIGRKPKRPRKNKSDPEPQQQQQQQQKPATVVVVDPAQPPAPRVPTVTESLEPVDFDGEQYKKDEWASKYEHCSTILGLALRDFDCLFINAVTDRQFYMEVLLPQLDKCRERADQYRIREDKPRHRGGKSIMARCQHLEYTGPMIVENKLISEIVYADLDDLSPDALNGLLVIYYNPDSTVDVERSRTSLINKTETAVIYQMDRRTLVELGEHSIVNAWKLRIALPWSLERSLVVAQYGARVDFSLAAKLEIQPARISAFRQYLLSPEALVMYAGVMRYERLRLFQWSKKKLSVSEQAAADEEQQRAEALERDPYFEERKRHYDNAADTGIGTGNDDEDQMFATTPDWEFWKKFVENDDLRSEATTVTSSKADESDTDDSSGISSFVLSEQEGRNSFTMRVDQHEFSDCLYEPVSESTTAETSQDAMSYQMPISRELSRDPSQSLIHRLNLALAAGIVLCEHYYDSRLDRWEPTDFCYLFALVERQLANDVIAQWVAELRANKRAFLGVSTERAIGLVHATHTLAESQAAWVRELFIDNPDKPAGGCAFLHQAIDTFQVASTVEKRRTSLKLIESRRATVQDVESYCKEFQLFSLLHRFRHGQRDADKNIADVILEFDAKQATPLELTSSTKNAAPATHSGVDFLVVHTVLAYMAIRGEEEPASRRRVYLCMTKETWRVITLGLVPRTITQLRTAKRPVALQQYGLMAPIINAALSDPNATVVTHALAAVQLMSFSALNQAPFQWRQESRAAQKYAKKTADTLSVYAQSLTQIVRSAGEVWTPKPFETPAEATKRLSMLSADDLAGAFARERSTVVANVANGIMWFVKDPNMTRTELSNVSSIFAGLQLVLCGNGASFVINRADLEDTLRNSKLKEDLKRFLHARLAHSGNVAEVIMRRTKLSEDHAAKLAKDPSSVLECFCGISTQECNRMRVMLPMKLSNRCHGGLENLPIECCICNQYSAKALAQIQRVSNVLLRKTDRRGGPGRDFYKTCDECIKRGANLHIKNINPNYVLLFNARSPRETGYTALQFVEQLSLANDLITLGRVRLCIGTHVTGISMPKDNCSQRSRSKRTPKAKTADAERLKSLQSLLEVAKARAAASSRPSKKRQIVLPSTEAYVEDGADDEPSEQTASPAVASVIEAATVVFNKHNNGRPSVFKQMINKTQDFLSQVKDTSTNTAISSPTRQRFELVLALESMSFTTHREIADIYHASLRPLPSIDADGTVIPVTETPEQRQNRLIATTELAGMLSPMSEAAHVKAVNSFAVAEHFLETSTLFPLCSSALVESMPYGVLNLRGHASDPIDKIFLTAAALLTSGRVPRPFAETIPEMLTTLFTNFQDPSPAMTVADVVSAPRNANEN
jgi:hypothetical protein